MWQFIVFKYGNMFDKHTKVVLLMSDKSYAYVLNDNNLCKSLRYLGPS